MTQQYLADRMRRPAQMVNEVIQGKKVITPETALDLEAVLALPAEMWLQLQMSYQLEKARYDRNLRRYLG